MTRKLAPYMDGIDLTESLEGDVLNLPRRQAELLIAEEWALALRRRNPVLDWSAALVRTVVGTTVRQRARTGEQLRSIREQMRKRSFDRHQNRRAEDRMREELHDARARTVYGT